jgi:hypothetical protein
VHRNLEISAFENPTKAKENTVPINTVKGISKRNWKWKTWLLLSSSFMFL